MANLKVRDFDGGAKYIEKGSGDGTAADPYSDYSRAPVNEYFHRHTGAATTIAVETAVNDTSITVVSDVGFNVGDHFQLENGSTESTFPEITAKPGGNVLTLDRPIDRVYVVGSTVEAVAFNMAVAGTLTSPIEFKVTPDVGYDFFIHRLMITMTHSAAGDHGLFGGQAALTNGVVLRSYIGGVFTTLSNWKTNADIKLDMHDLDYDPRSGGGGIYGTSARGSLNKLRVESRFQAGDYLQLLVQDNITNLSFEMKAQGRR